ncbi:hypothetical protein [Benzoatithermus flavus]|uniref:Lipoprotein n=1 Tax=Benzoatithermus flavus TaxID=3108223 RepID=A0ABU8XRR8_9PROT
MARQKARGATLLFLLLTACSSGEEPPPLNYAQMRPIRLAVQSIEVGSNVRYPANLNFIGRRRSEDLANEAQNFLRNRLQAAGGTEFGKATVEEASLIERARETSGGMLSTEPTWEMAGVLALKVAIVDGLGIEQSYATSRVQIARSLSPRSSVEAKDNFAKTLIHDLIEASSRELEQSINQNLADKKAL